MALLPVARSLLCLFQYNKSATHLSGCERENNPAQGENIHGQGVNIHGG